MLLYRKDLGRVEISSRIDERMCEHFNIEPDYEDYYLDWPKVIGSKLYKGLSFEQIKEEIKKEFDDGPETETLKRFLEIVDWLNTYYVFRK